MRRNRPERSRVNRVRKKDARMAAGREDRKGLLKIMGIVLVTTMILGVFSSFWVGWKIRTSLKDLENQKESAREMQEKNLLLVEKRNQLMTRDVIEKKASVLGLRTPEDQQVILQF